jgi:hypothetical protein
MWSGSAFWICPAGRHSVDVLTLATFYLVGKIIKREYKPEKHAVNFYLFTIFSSEVWLIRGRGPGKENLICPYCQNHIWFLGIPQGCTDPDNL